MINNNNVVVLSCLFLASCASSNTIKTSSNTAIVQTSAAPVCGGAGAANVAQKQAAIETLKGGFDSYIIVDAAASSDVQVSQLPGSYHTSGTATVYSNRATYSGNTQYIPGPTIVSGGHQQAFAIRMFRNGEVVRQMQYQRATRWVPSGKRWSKPGQSVLAPRASSMNAESD